MIEEKLDENESLFLEFIHLMQIEESKVEMIEKERDKMIAQLEDERKAKEDLVRKFGSAFEMMASFHNSTKAVSGEEEAEEEA